MLSNGRSKMGLKTQNCYVVIHRVVRPIVTYASAVWCNKTNQKTAIDTLNSLQRTACLTATGAFSSTPGAALDALLDIIPLHLQVQKEAKQCVYRICTLNRPKWRSQALANLKAWVFANRTLSMPTDDTHTECHLTKLYTVEIPPRDKWINNQMYVEEGSHVWYTDGSKKGNDVGCGIYGERPKLRASVSMGTQASIFQAEVFAINKCAEINLDRNLRHQHIYINSDSQAALLALESLESNSKLVQNCKTNLNALANSNKVTLRWVPGHSDINGNEEADELARKGADTPLVGPEPFCGITKRDAYSLLSKLEKTRATEWWKFVKGQEHSKALIKGFNSRTAKELLGLKRHKTCAVTRILTGHCKLNKHMFQIGKKQDATCRFCQESEETAMHILCSCGPLMSKRSTYLGRHVVQPYEVQNITAQRI
ncbi:uncharacterized protein LOC134676066 [Cydia fagiglandana]|uniref:uncharacterized protein LOC134676066 n=1 Tax=Cydia fagiglandana TaxID=1458189 RepID=UPI002FEDE7C2